MSALTNSLPVFEQVQSVLERNKCDTCAQTPALSLRDAGGLADFSLMKSTRTTSQRGGCPSLQA